MSQPKTCTGIGVPNGEIKPQMMVIIAVIRLKYRITCTFFEKSNDIFQKNQKEI